MLVQHFLENSARRLPDKVALVCGKERLTYQEINEKADILAGALIEMGVKHKDRVVIFLDNSSEAVVSLFGILTAGAIFVMLNPGMRANKLKYILKDSGAVSLITQTSKSRIVEQAVKGVSCLKHIIWIGDRNKFGEGISAKIKIHQWDKILPSPKTSNLARHASKARRVGLKPNASAFETDLATLIYTSGSTGEPKGVMSAHCNMVAAAQSVINYLENVRDDIILNTLPLSFSYGLYQILMAFLLGSTVVLEKSFAYPNIIMKRLVEERATGFAVVPTMLAIILQMEGLSKFDFSSLRYITSAAAALPVSHIRKFRKIFPHIKIYSMYGLTECKRVSYMPPQYLDHKPDSVGIPMPNVEVSIVDEKGEELGPGQIGELVVRGPNVMQGYWNSPEETARVFRLIKNNGKRALYTGDLFRKDADGFLYFVSRKDDLIKTKGKLVSPKEIENKLCQMEGVSEAAVIGIPDNIMGQAIKVFVASKSMPDLKIKDVKRFCQQNLESFMVPKYIELRERLPKTSSGKIDKKKLN